MAIEDSYDEIEFPEPKKPKKKKKGVNGKAKGNAYEREICKKLSNLLTFGEEEYAIWRSASSGAVATNILKKNNKTKESFLKAHSGDIVQAIPKGTFPHLDWFFDTFFVETKFYKDLSLYPPFTKELKTFVSQLLHEKKSSGKEIIFIFKANNKSDLVFTDHSFAYNKKLQDHKQMTVYVSGKALDIYLLKDFLNYYILPNKETLISIRELFECGVTGCQVVNTIDLGRIDDIEEIRDEDYRGSSCIPTEYFKEDE